MRILQEFNPSPGLFVSSQPVEYIVPDIHVIEKNGRFEVKVNDEGMPDLRISKIYKDLLSSDKTDSQTRKYLQENLDKAIWLLRAIHGRQKTLRQVASSIVSRQQGFFKKGSHLRPMTLKDIAKKIGVHESTVSRAVSGKYMQTPKGIFELKYFFRKGIEGKNGVSISSNALRIKIRLLIDGEDPQRPLTDQAIAGLLEKEGLSVARRTVAKYRGELGVEGAAKRRKQAGEIQQAQKRFGTD